MSNISIGNMTLGIYQTNCYFVYREDSDKVLVFDPADHGKKIEAALGHHGLHTVAIFLTHGHFDHILAVPELSRSFHVPVYASAVEDAMLADTSLNLSGTCDSEPTSFHADELLRDGQEFTLLGLNWKLIATPGHTAGSACRGCSSASGPAPQPAYRPPAFSSSSARRPFAVNRTA